MAQSSRKDVRIFAFDVDGPIYSQDIDIDFALYLTQKKRFKKKAAKDFREAIKRYEEGKLSYPDLCRESINLFAQGIQKQHAARLYEDAFEFVRQNRSLFHKEAIQMLRNLGKRKNTKIVLISGSPAVVISALSRVLGFRVDYIRGVGYQMRKGRFTGIPLTRDLIEYKQKALNFVEKWFKAKKQNIIYYGNHVADWVSAEAAGVRFRPMRPSKELRELWAGRQRVGSRARPRPKPRPRARQRRQRK